jgi:hypothetical protein
MYECGQCSTRFVAPSPFEADKPNGYYLELLQVTGEKYIHHARTPAPVFYCTKRCLLGGIADDIPSIVTPTAPPA